MFSGLNHQKVMRYGKIAEDVYKHGFAFYYIIFMQNVYKEP